MYVSVSFSVSEYAGVLMIRTQPTAYILLGLCNMMRHCAPSFCFVSISGYY
jgi:hypothetical protein